MKFELQQVEFMPKELEPNVLYVSETYGTAAHLCACGCGAKIRTPLGPTEWSVRSGRNGPTLRPSVGNWQLPCRSHYFITNGEIEWASQWSEARIQAGRVQEAARREAHLENRRNVGFFASAWHWIKSLLGA